MRRWSIIRFLDLALLTYLPVQRSEPRIRGGCRWHSSCFKDVSQSRLKGHNLALEKVVSGKSLEAICTQSITMGPSRHGYSSRRDVCFSLKLCQNRSRHSHRRRQRTQLRRRNPRSPRKQLRQLHNDRRKITATGQLSLKCMGISGVWIVRSGFYRIKCLTEASERSSCSFAFIILVREALEGVEPNTFILFTYSQLVISEHA